MNVPNEGPAIVLREMLPGRHGASTIADLPEELTVRLVLDLLRCPIGRLRAERSRGHAITLAFRAVARDAIDLGDLLALIHDLRISRQGILLRLLRRRRLPGRARRGPAPASISAIASSSCRLPVHGAVNRPGRDHL